MHRINITLSDEDYLVFLEICKKRGIRPTSLAAEVILNFMSEKGINKSCIDYLTSSEKKVGIYFCLSKRNALKLDHLCWDEKKTRALFVRSIVEKVINDNYKK